MRSFSFLELITTVAVLAVLSSLSLPALYDYQARSKQSEVRSFLATTRDAAIAYEAAWDAMPEPLTMNPRLETLGKQARPWIPDPGWARLGVEPDGLLYGSYGLQTNPTLDWWSLQAATNVDGDDVAYMFYWHRDGWMAEQCYRDGVLLPGPCR